MPTLDPDRLLAATDCGAEPFEPSAALAILDAAARDRGAEAGPAWDAAWIACLTNSPRWAETARREFARVAARSRGRGGLSGPNGSV